MTYVLKFFDRIENRIADETFEAQTLEEAARMARNLLSHEVYKDAVLCWWVDGVQQMKGLVSGNGLEVV